MGLKYELCRWQHIVSLCQRIPHITHCYGTSVSIMNPPRKSLWPPSHYTHYHSPVLLIHPCHPCHPCHLRESVLEPYNSSTSPFLSCDSWYQFWPWKVTVSGNINSEPCDFPLISKSVGLVRKLPFRSWPERLWGPEGRVFWTFSKRHHCPRASAITGPLSSFPLFILLFIFGWFLI